jgi:hypothetical protein
MKKQFFNTLAFIGLISFGLFLALCLLDLLSFNSLWVKYVLLISLLVLFIGLSNAFKKFTDYSEGISCLRRATKTLNLIKGRDIKKINYVRLLSIKNQLNNAEIYIKNVVDRFDLYELRSDVARIAEIEHHYELDNRSNLTNEMMLKDIKDITESFEKIKFIKSNNVLIK